MKTVFISGNFSVLHPGHIRLFKLAKNLGNKLIIGINSDEYTISSLKVPLALRIEALESINMVDQVIVIRNDLLQVIESIKPNYVLKGREHESRFNSEEIALAKYDGKLVFGAGDFAITSAQVENKVSTTKNIELSLANNFVERNKLSDLECVRLVNDFSKLKVLVIGDLIIDEYIECESIGMSQEDPLVVFRSLENQKFVGGAGIVALHAASLGADTTFLTLAGQDEGLNFANGVFVKSKVKTKIVSSGISQTSLKKRYRVNGNTRFRLNQSLDVITSNTAKSELLNFALSKLNDIDVLIFSDFNYGVLDAENVNNILSEARKFKIFVSADCQISSQISDYLKFKDTDLVTPTEHEVRVTLRDSAQGLAALANKFQEILSVPNLLVTLGGEGLLVQYPSEANPKEYLTDLIPALNTRPTDVAGAGDSVLVVASLAMACGARIEEAAFLGSLAASLQVGKIGNIPLDIDELRNLIKL
jgi:rfaE bifunctional protein kinase chain/domain